MGINELDIREELKYSGYEMMIYYNPYFHKFRIEQYEESKTNLYYQVGHTEFDEIEGIRLRSDPVENLAIRACAITDTIDKAEKKYQAYRKDFEAHTSHLTPLQLTQVDSYFQNQIHSDEGLYFEVVEDLKEKLYQSDNNIDPEHVAKAKRLQKKKQEQDRIKAIRRRRKEKQKRDYNHNDNPIPEISEADKRRMEKMFLG